MHGPDTRSAVLALLADGCTTAAVSRELGVARSTIRSWRDDPLAVSRAACWRCGDGDVPGEAYAALLGFYLGDGYLARVRGLPVLRVSCDPTYPLVVEDVRELVRRVRPSGHTYLTHPLGTVVVHSGWKHWVCLFPQHGPGRKHERHLDFHDWQRQIVECWPEALLRGLFHSDGSRVNNWATRKVAGEQKRYEYPRWQFVNHSEQIRDICADALDLVGVPYRRSSWKTISVSTRSGVARLDDLIGPKS